MKGFLSGTMEEVPSASETKERLSGRFGARQALPALPFVFFHFCFNFVAWFFSLFL